MSREGLTRAVKRAALTHEEKVEPVPEPFLHSEHRKAGLISVREIIRETTIDRTVINVKEVRLLTTDLT